MVFPIEMQPPGCVLSLEALTFRLRSRPLYPGCDTFRTNIPLPIKISFTETVADETQTSYGLKLRRGYFVGIGIFPHLHSESNRICASIAMASSPNDAGFQILSGWKEIANYLGKGVRTIQRYERDLRLPIHRPAGKSSSSVIAVKAELDHWVKGAPVQLDERAMRLRAQTNIIGAQFLQIDTEVALTFTSMALKARSPEKRERQVEVAQKAYDTILRLRQKFDLNQAEMDSLDASLRRLKSELHELQKKL